MAVFAAMALLPACSSDYLDLTPESNVADVDALKTAELIQVALNGVYSGMNTQYQGTSLNQYSGEGYVNTMFIESMGADYIGGLAGSSWSYEAMKGEQNRNSTYNVVTVPWNYCYSLLQQVNKILDLVDEAEGTEAEIANVKAQALTMRAFCYTKLLSLYAPRWEDSNEGDVYCVVLRTSGAVQNYPLAKMKDVLDLIYSDLDQALELFDKGGYSRSYKWQVDKSIAQGVYARIALLKNDWKKAQEMAHSARQAYSIMDNQTYMSGFFTDNNDFMWESDSKDSDIYYWSWGSHFAANGQYVNAWGLGGGAIDLDLYNQMDPNDIRRQLYFTPDKIDYVVSVNKAWNPGRITEADFWSPSLVDSSNWCNIAVGASAKVDAGADGKWGLYNVAVRYFKYYVENLFTGSVNDINNTNFFAYYSLGATGDMNVGNGMQATLCSTPFGAQLKFFSYGPYGNGVYSFMRASEMCLAEAEAAYHNNDYATAQNCLQEINGIRIPGYTCNKTGEDLFEEIMLSRRIELWGEGHSFTDFKRWNRDIVRRAWVADDPTSGNWIAEMATTMEASNLPLWTMIVPRAEYDYNSLIDLSLLPYGGATEE